MFEVANKLEDLIKYIRDTTGINDKNKCIDIIYKELNKLVK